MIAILKSCLATKAGSQNVFLLLGTLIVLADAVFRTCRRHFVWKIAVV
ncbi:hypothetical protein [Dyadobacter koreensis]|nr:hypothetical protein [Dyadobacter koreensis]